MEVALSGTQSVVMWSPEYCGSGYCAMPLRWSVTYLWLLLEALPGKSHELLLALGEVGLGSHLRSRVSEVMQRAFACTHCAG